ncbi:MAG: radical SAM protein [Deltaproteobacteria bacterium]|nr:radical SAM protein [Deltaproteobacteria bacterium]
MKIPSNVTKKLERGLSGAAAALWPAVQRLNAAVESRPFQPEWAPAPMVKSKARSFPQLGWPRQTDSLCPRCVQEVRAEILSGARELDELRTGRPGEIKATILERDGKVLMVKECPKHGRFEDVLASDPEFLRRMERLFPGRDHESPKTPLRNHGSSSVKYGRGAVLTVDLTNRCNMMCDPCFTDANQVGFVHELTWEDVKEILDNSTKIKPRRQMTVQFSGGEPTLSPLFLQAIRYAREVGYISVQCATNGLRFALEPDFAAKAREAGLRLAYLQFDGVGNENNAHRKISNLFDVKLRAIQNLKKADIDVVLVTTIVNGVNDHQVGPILDFAIENIDAVTTIAFQPVSFTGRDEEIDDETRARQRYTLSHLAHDLKRQTGHLEPLRDWFPLSALQPFADMTDVLLGEEAKWGSISCGCHPSCGIGTILMVHKETREAVPLTQFLNVDQLLRDIRSISDANRSRPLTYAQLALAVMRNYDARKAPRNLDLMMLIRQYLSQTGAVGLGKDDAAEFPWRVLFIGGMWFQDLFTYDFRRTEMCIIPYGTQLGEISFCAYNTGIGWRNIIEQMYAVASVADWYKEKGRHEIYARPDKPLDLPDYGHDPLEVRVPRARPTPARATPFSAGPPSAVSSCCESKPLALAVAERGRAAAQSPGGSLGATDGRAGGGCGCSTSAQPTLK